MDEVVIAYTPEPPVSVPLVDVLDVVATPLVGRCMDDQKLRGVFHYTEISMTKESLTKSP